MIYLEGKTGQNFDWRDYLAERADVLHTAAGRRAACRLDPLLFGLIYFRAHLTDKPTGTVTFADLHLDMCRRARQWARTDLDLEEVRDAWVAWRESGKSTWNFLILPTWALAMRHRRYALAFADSGNQAEQHLTTFRMEMQQNALLRKDHPALTSASKRNGVSVSDTKSMYVAQSGVVFQAKGIDASSLGIKYGDERPDLILLDDIEPSESNYSEYQKGKRLDTVIKAVFPMNMRAAVSLTGTVTMSGSVVDDIVRHVREPTSDDLPEWPAEQQIKPRYYPLMRLNPETGQEESAHETRFPLEWMTRPIREGGKRLCDTAAFQLNYQNSGRGSEGGWWTDDDFAYQDLSPTRWILQIDPAVTETGKSDFTALTVHGYTPGPRGMVTTAFARKVKMVGEPLRQLVINILNEFPRVKLVRLECNQGGDMWKTILHHLPVPMDLVPSTDPKIARIAGALDWYQRGRVVHSQTLPTLEKDCINYPKGLHDDLVDCNALGILYFLGKPPTRLTPDRKSSSYL